MKQIISLFLILSITISSNAQQWSELFTFETVETASIGVETDGINFYTAKWNSDDFHRYDMDGTNPVAFTVPGAANIRDMAYDGQYFYGANADMNLFQMDFTNETLINTITATCTGITGIYHIAYDPNLDSGNGGFWIGNNNELGAIAMDGSELIANIQGNITCYGSAYDGTDVNNPKLWLFQQTPNYSAYFVEFDINTLSFTGFMYDASSESGYAGGACSYEKDNKLILAGSIQKAPNPNLIVVFELATLNAPATVTNLTAIADETGLLTADLQWTNPTVDVNENALSDLTSIDVYLNNDFTSPIYTNNSPKIGGDESFVASPTIAGNHTFTIIATNSNGIGLIKSITVLIGEVVLFDFETGIPDSFTLIDGTCGWESGTDGSSEYWDIYPHTTYAYVNDDACGENGNMSNVWMILPEMNFSEIDNPFITFENVRRSSNTTPSIFTIKISTDNENWTDIETLSTDNINLWQTENIDLSAYANEPTVYIAFYYNDGGEWAYGWAIDNIVISNTFESNVAINKTENTNFKIYPNPSNGIFNLEASARPSSVTITNITGKIIYMTRGHASLQIDIQNQPTGIYFIKIKTENSFFTQKLIIN